MRIKLRRFLRDFYTGRGSSRTEQLKVASRHPFAVPFITFGVLLVLSVLAYLLFFQDNSPIAPIDSRVVIVSYDHHERAVPTRAKTVGKLLERLHISLHQGDVVEPAIDTQILQDNFHVNIYRAVPVKVVDGDTATFAYSAATTPRSIASQAGQQVYPEDKVVTTPVTDFVREGSIGEQIAITRSTPVNLNLYGTAAPTRTLAKTVGDMLKEKNVKLTNGATVTPAAETPIVANMQVFILAKGIQIVSQEEVVPMPVQNVDDANLTFGTHAIRQKGAPGKQLVTYQVTSDPKTHQELSRTVIQSVVTQDPVTEVVAVGKAVQIPKDKTQIMQAAGVSPSDYKYVDYIISHEGGWGGVTKYNSSGSGAYGICQALPGSKMASAGADWRTNPVTQLKWCSGYAVGRYGSWAGAYSYWIRHHYW